MRKAQEKNDIQFEILMNTKQKFNYYYDKELKNSEMSSIVPDKGAVSVLMCQMDESGNPCVYAFSRRYKRWHRSSKLRREYKVY